ncbi:hypothetical protein G7009_20690 [Pseudomonas capeferrum]|uniref:hypothetical protein n=1 Tax=Pseudomonas capeferrum TaxID=1495066 RepID=UPI0015E451B2|nr:hypothetical protein [Pseudomonas capeferrum]MBA1204142.1 hypothetical protein [Pseudomonas capeferrum]
MRAHAVLLLLSGLASGSVLAEACDVSTRSSSAAIASVDEHTCYEFTGVPAESINWSCSNESKEMLNSEKRKVAQCPDKSQGRCTATLTQESLANPKSAGSGEPSTRPALSKDARVITYYYGTANLGQARTDCEQNDGKWDTE